MSISTIWVENLTGGVGRARGSHEYNCVGNFLIGGHAFAKGNIFFDGSKCLSRDFRGYQANADTSESSPRQGLLRLLDPTLGQVQCPFPGKCIHCSLGRGIAGGSALARLSYF